MILTILFSLLIQGFTEDFQTLKQGDKISKDFAVKYLNAHPDHYEEYFVYETYMKPKFVSCDLSTLIYTENSGTCRKEILVIFDQNGKILSKLVISSNCDHDMSIPTYKSWEFQLNLYSSEVVLDISSESVKDKSKIDGNGHIIGDKDFMDLETIKTNLLEVYKISKDGKIIKQ